MVELFGLAVASPDMKVCGLFLWGDLKKRTHSFNNDKQLNHITGEIMLQIPKIFFCNAFDLFVTRYTRYVSIS